jgi:microcystin-dependent protein
MDVFLGTILAFGFNFNPRGWQLCYGQLVPISQYNALFALLGTNYGGNGTSTFGLPDLRGRSLVGQGQGPGLSNIVIGELSGNENITLTANNMPIHGHPLAAANSPITVAVNAISLKPITNDPDNGNNYFAAGGTTPNIYSETGGTDNAVGGVTAKISGATGVAGGSQPFGLRNPYLGINYCIAMEGIFPSRN